MHEEASMEIINSVSPSSEGRENEHSSLRFVAALLEQFRCGSTRAVSYDQLWFPTLHSTDSCAGLISTRGFWFGLVSFFNLLMCLFSGHPSDYICSDHLFIMGTIDLYFFFITWLSLSPSSQKVFPQWQIILNHVLLRFCQAWFKYCFSIFLVNPKIVHLGLPTFSGSLKIQVR